MNGRRDWNTVHTSGNSQMQLITIRNVWSATRFQSMPLLHALGVVRVHGLGGHWASARTDLTR